ncbi:MAG: enoyl-[acyl-carrier-protein] reductase FabV [Spirochaetae bacterium HGW-Spirochaetae-9]|nr:MAG: enoyl-[acyl-carrier-protein] reductase FabV [Spirochaetae bacterium HGW-Spirochaetae-9]
MIIKPMVRNNIFLNAHPAGCAREVQLQIERALAFGATMEAVREPGQGRPARILVIGASTGYGLASRIAAGFAYGAATVGISYEKEPTASKTATPGWYANRAFDAEAAKAGLFSKTFDVDAFSHEAKTLAIETARSGGFVYDLVIYSLASPVRVDPDSGTMYRSVIKPIGRAYAGKTVDVFSGRISEAHIQPADEKEIEETVKVMGGEDWSLWIDALASAGVLGRNALTLAYSYLGPPLSWPIYRDGTIGQAKAHLEESARSIGAKHGASGLRAFVSINKAVVTRASAVIPVIPLYVSTLFKVMKDRKIHEDCLDQMLRLFRERLYRRDAQTVPVDVEGRIRLDELEMGASVQGEVSSRLARVNEENMGELADIEGFRSDFLCAHGFDVPGVDYEAEVDPL